MTARIRVTLADDHPIVLAGLRNLVQAEPDLELVGEAATGLSALKVIREKQPDVALLDISMPELNGILLSRRLAAECPSVRVLMMTLHEDRAYLKQALDAGVRGYVLKRSAAENLVHAIRAVMVGGLYMDPAIADRVLDGAAARAGVASSKGGTSELTERETEVLKFAALGFTNKEIARRLDIGIKSVETYKARGAEKLDLRTRADIVRYAAARGWLADL
jgi:DNA-binding NarL/FixJ family response regulator